MNHKNKLVDSKMYLLLVDVGQFMTRVVERLKIFLSAFAFVSIEYFVCHNLKRLLFWN